MKPSDIFKSVGRPIAYYPRLAKVCGGVSASVLVCQFMYWTDKTKDADGWIYKTQAEIEDETGLTPKEQRHARTQLAGMLEAKYDRLNHRQYYRVNTDLLDQAIESAWGESTVPKGTSPKVPKGTSGTDEKAPGETPFEELPKADFGNSGMGTSIEQRVLSEIEASGESEAQRSRLSAAPLVNLYKAECERHHYTAKSAWCGALAGQAKALLSETDPQVLESAVRLLASERKHPKNLTYVVVDLESARGGQRAQPA